MASNLGFMVFRPQSDDWRCPLNSIFIAIELPSFKSGLFNVAASITRTDDHVIAIFGSDSNDDFDWTFSNSFSFIDDYPIANSGPAGFNSLTIPF